MDVRDVEEVEDVVCIFVREVLGRVVVYIRKEVREACVEVGGGGEPRLVLGALG